MDIDRKYERDIDILLAEEFKVSPMFTAWFLKQTRKFASIEAHVLYAYVSMTDWIGESDLVVIYQPVAGPSFALLIEDKIDALLQPDQEARYRRRAEAEVGRAHDAKYSDYEVILCAPKSYSESHPQTRSFDSFVSYEKIGNFLKSNDSDLRNAYRAAFILSAAKKSTSNWTPIQDEVTDKFWEKAYLIANKQFPELQLKRLKLTKDSTWITLRPFQMPTQPKSIYISLKGDKGHMDLTFGRCLLEKLHPRVSMILEEGMTLDRTGQSVAIRITVPGFNVVDLDLDSDMEERLRTAFAACARLAHFYNKYRDVLNQAALESSPE